MADRVRLLVALALATALSGCSVPVRGVPGPDRSPGPSSAGQLAPSPTYADPNGRFTIVPPPGFTSEVVNGTTTRFVDPLVENDRSYPGTRPGSRSR
jgi:hypothetical protein